MRTRKPPRLPSYDYTRNGTYFVTICLRGRRPLLGRVEIDEVVLSRFGRLVADEIHRLEPRFQGIAIDGAVVMPDHAHLIVGLHNQERKLGTIVGAVKASSAREINRARGTTGAAVWQRSYHEHVIRDEANLQRVREYVATNPTRWTISRSRP